jgi:hypothetical protein
MGARTEGEGRVAWLVKRNPETPVSRADFEALAATGQFMNNGSATQPPRMQPPRPARALPHEILAGDDAHSNIVIQM